MFQTNDRADSYHGGGGVPSAIADGEGLYAVLPSSSYISPTSHAAFVQFRRHSDMQKPYSFFVLEFPVPRSHSSVAVSTMVSPQEGFVQLARQ
jgi:hypothetical protein